MTGWRTCGGGLLGTSISGTQACVADDSMNVGSLIWGLSLGSGCWRTALGWFGAEWTFLWKQTLGTEPGRTDRGREAAASEPFSVVVVPFGFLAAQPPEDPPRDQQEDGEHAAGARYDPGPTCRQAPLAPSSLSLNAAGARTSRLWRLSALLGNGADRTPVVASPGGFRRCQLGIFHSYKLFLEHARV